VSQYKVRIKWVNHPNPALQHLNGTAEIVLREDIGAYLISGQCILFPYKNYVDRLTEEEKARQAALPPDPNAIVGVQWSVTTSVFDPRKASICRKTQWETSYGPPEAFKEAIPKNVLANYYAIKNQPDPESLAERRVQEQYRQEAADREQKAREYGSAVAKFGTQVVRS
jgi:hypothetical protein